MGARILHLNAPSGVRSVIYLRAAPSQGSAGCWVWCAQVCLAPSSGAADDALEWYAIGTLDQPGEHEAIVAGMTELLDAGWLLSSIAHLATEPP